MIYRIKHFKALDGFRLLVSFDDGKTVIYDVSDDINTLPGYQMLKSVHGLFPQAKLDQSRTCVYWNKDIDLPSDAIYLYGNEVPFPDEIEAIESTNKSIAEGNIVPFDAVNWD